MTEYKNTLNLPVTAFPMKAKLTEMEPQLLQKWEQEDLYQNLRKIKQGKEKFILHDGPPYANGELHIGHAINKILKDITIKSQSLNGKDAPYIPGWDCHGLPIEAQVEKKIGKAGQKIDFAEFRAQCHQYALTQVAQQKQIFVRMGIWADWSNPYLTNNKATEAATVRALAEIMASGMLVRGYKPVYWSVMGKSALAEAEVEYQDKTSFSIDVSYAVKAEHLATLSSAFNIEPRGEFYVQIWTTTPWTLPSSQAISINPNFIYALVLIDGKPTVLAKNLIEKTLERMQVETYEVIATCMGEKLQGIITEHPFYERPIPLLCGDHVTDDDGTGCVHTSPDHGADDFSICQKHHIDTLNYINDSGVFEKHVPLMAGTHVYKADEVVINILQKQDCLRSLNKIIHSYPHCWRTKTPLIFRATPQLFITMSDADIKHKLLQQVDKVQWIPNWGKARIQSMLASSPDWCISRQRTWGVPIPLFIDSVTGALHPDSITIMQRVANTIEEKGMDAWFESSAEDWLGTQASKYIKLNDTLDVWFDSGVTHFSVLRNNPALQFPADLYLEGSDQHRGWFQSSLKTSTIINKCAPYKQVLTHGFTIDEKGRKMSKSQGNFISAETVINKYGADILRLWVASTDYSSDIIYSDSIIKQISDNYRRIRNTMRYCLANLNDFNISNTIKHDELIELDAWVVNRTIDLQQQIKADFDQYLYHFACQKLLRFCSVDLGGFYLDIIKDRIYTCPHHSHARLSAQTAIHHIIQILVRCIAPILSFTADEIWGYLNTQLPSVFFSEHSTTPRVKTTNITDQQWQHIIEVKEHFNRQLDEMRKIDNIGSSLAANVDIICHPPLFDTLSLLGDELRFILISSDVTLQKVASPTSSSTNPSKLNTLEMSITPAQAPKCVRCWHHHSSVGAIESDVDICSRCYGNINGSDERRTFA